MSKSRLRLARQCEIIITEMNLKGDRHEYTSNI